MFWLRNKKKKYIYFFVMHSLNTNEFHRFRKTKLLSVKHFLTHHFNICFGCSKELSHREGSFGYLQRMFWLRNKKYIYFFVMHPLNTYEFHRFRKTNF